ncbi:LamG domain-containing protein [Synechocystis sp. CACIAM 05]|uniref:LamG domain-containing protein n=1 Tax=Synechocystis sp. CACIAM 05 TaxID=1933929 RepID=UPI00138E74BE|nr:LamG domain-containing protein [Synechocystis sp. CACIAM 05]QHU99584.1 hypothetical protein BWK47_05195 [Synechocystis sp. CACIAM 05]
MSRFADQLPIVTEPTPGNYLLGTDENDPKALVRIPAEGLGSGGSTEYTILNETALNVDGFINIIPGSYLYVGNQKAKIDCSLLENGQRVEFINLSLFDCFFLGFNDFINYTNEGILLEGEGLALKKGGVIFSIYNNTCLFFANYVALNKLFYDGDPFANQVILLLHFEGAEGSTNYLDESPLNLTVSNFGAAKITQTKQKYGLSSFLSNSSSNYLSANSTSIPCTNTFTIEAWVFFTSWADNKSIFCFKPSTANEVIFAAYSNQLALWIASGTVWSTNQAVFTNQWVHLAVASNNGQCKIFRNGIQIGNTFTFPLNNFNINYIRIGTNTASKFCEYVDAFRFTANACRYLSNFNPEFDTYLT